MEAGSGIGPAKSIAAGATSRIGLNTAPPLYVQLSPLFSGPITDTNGTGISLTGNGGATISSCDELVESVPTWVDGGNIQVFDNGHDTSRVVEIDPAVVRVAKKFFLFEPGSRITVIEADGREHLGQQANGTRRPPTRADAGNAFQCCS